MSYDLTLFRMPAGVDPTDAFNELMGREEAQADPVDERTQLSAELQESMRRIADALKSWRPALVEFQLEKPLPWIELTDEDLLVQFTIGEESVGITIPYFGDRAEELFDCVTGSFSVVNEATGYVAFDPQLGRVVAAADFKEIVGRYRSVDKGSLLRSIAASDPLGSPSKPWWKFW